VRTSLIEISLGFQWETAGEGGIWIASLIAAVCVGFVKHVVRLFFGVVRF
jgi:hypothetical protein